MSYSSPSSKGEGWPGGVDCMRGLGGHGAGGQLQCDSPAEDMEGEESRLWDSKPRPALYESAALPAELSRRMKNAYVDRLAALSLVSPRAAPGRNRHDKLHPIAPAKL